LSESDIVFWMGEELTPWLEKAIDNVASSSKKVGMLDLAVTTTYPFREGTTFEEHAHHDSEESEHGHHDEPHADDHAEHSKTNEEHEAHHGGLIDRFLSLFSSGHHDHEDDHHDEHEDEHDEEHADHEAHLHDGVDPHAWLDPENAKQWVTEISRVLSEQDPENATTYQANASTAIVALDQLIEQTQAEVSKLGDLRFVVFHDAYQYFERRFDIAAAGSISLGDAEDPSPARITEIRNTVQTLGVTCVFAEPQFNEGLVKNIFADSAVTRIGVMDPLGAD
ncbi:zinc transporter, partial [Oleiphilus sp. HI0065]